MGKGALLAVGIAVFVLACGNLILLIGCLSGCSARDCRRGRGGGGGGGGGGGDGGGGGGDGGGGG